MSSPSETVNAELPTVEDFLQTIERSGLLDHEQLQAAIAAAPPEMLAKESNSAPLADFLIKTGKLSRFQARKLLQGTHRGLVLGPYQILAPLGKGGMGAVYMARDGRGGRLVALKVLSSRRAREEERTRHRFLREMELNKLVSHPHLALTYEVGTLQDVHYIAMEFIPGKSLHRIVAEEGPLTVARAARLLAEVAAALDHAHEMGLIHRDLKPSNIMITPNDHAKVLDFGLAYVQGEKADIEVVGGQGYIVGTMDYISPEQSRDPTNVDPRSDVYSLGCTLYYALCGQPPFPGGTSHEKRQRHRAEEPTPLWQLRAGLPTGFVDLVHRLMSKDPDQRPPTARAVREELLFWAIEDLALPLDKPNDSNYRIAVAAFEDSSNDAYLLEDIPAPEAAPTAEDAPGIEDDPVVVAAPVAEPQRVAFDEEATPTSEHANTAEPMTSNSMPAWIVLALVLGIPTLLMSLACFWTALAWLVFRRN